MTFYLCRYCHGYHQRIYSRDNDILSLSRDFFITRSPKKDVRCVFSGLSGHGDIYECSYIEKKIEFTFACSKESYNYFIKRIFNFFPKNILQIYISRTEDFLKLGKNYESLVSYLPLDIRNIIKKYSASPFYPMRNFTITMIEQNKFLITSFDEKRYNTVVKNKNIVSDLDMKKFNNKENKIIAHNPFTKKSYKIGWKKYNKYSKDIFFKNSNISRQRNFR